METGCTFLWEGSCRADAFEGCSAGEGSSRHLRRRKQAGQRAVPGAPGRSTVGSTSTWLGTGTKVLRQPGERGRVTEQ